MSRGVRPQVISAILGVMLVLGGVAGGCGDPGSGESPTTSPTAPAMSSVTSGSSATPFTQATTAAPSSTAASGVVENGASAGAPAWQVTGDESSAGSTVISQFLDAVNAQDLASASNLLAPDAAFQLEDVTNRVRRITLIKPPIPLVPDEQGPAHLAMMGRGTAEVVAVQGSGLQSAAYGVQIGLRRESRRDEWRVWFFDLQPR